jgi:hypothetical protein
MKRKITIIKSYKTTELTIVLFPNWFYLHNYVSIIKIRVSKYPINIILSILLSRRELLGQKKLILFLFQYLLLINEKIGAKLNYKNEFSVNAE